MNHIDPVGQDYSSLSAPIKTSILPTHAHSTAESADDVTLLSEEDNPSVETIDFTKLWATAPAPEVNVMNRILRLLITLTKTMQGVAVSQANQLNLLTMLQQAYVQLQQKIPVVLKGSGLNVDDNGRNDINTKFSIYMEAVRANRGMVDDAAKKLQALLNTTKESGTQFSDLLSTLLELMRGLIATLFR